MQSEQLILVPYSRLKRVRTSALSEVGLCQAAGADLELGGKQMRRSKINLICKNVEELIVQSARGYMSVVFFCDSVIATLKIIKEEIEDDSLEVALDVVTKHIKK